MTEDSARYGLFSSIVFAQLFVFLKQDTWIQIMLMTVACSLWEIGESEQSTGGIKQLA